MWKNGHIASYSFYFGNYSALYLILIERVGLDIVDLEQLNTSLYNEKNFDILKRYGYSVDSDDTAVRIQKE